jgi:hypothetical protein
VVQGDDRRVHVGDPGGPAGSWRAEAVPGTAGSPSFSRIACAAADRCVLAGRSAQVRPGDEGGPAHPATVMVRTDGGWSGEWLVPTGAYRPLDIRDLSCAGDSCLALAAGTHSEHVLIRPTDLAANQWVEADRWGPSGPAGDARALACRPRWCMVVGARDRQARAVRYG